MKKSRKLTKDEIIENFRKILKLYADPKNWKGNQFINHYDVNIDDCAGNYQKNGELARQALLHEHATIPVKNNK